MKDNKQKTFASAKASRGSALTPREKRSSLIGIILNGSAVLVGFLFGGCHLVFGSYPLGLALVSALPSGVFFALAGVIAGSLSIGKGGIIFALAATLAVFLRVVISGGKERGAMFSESLLLRLAPSSVCGLILGVYELLVSGFGVTTLLFFASSVLLPVLLTPALAVLFDAGVSAEELLLGGGRILCRAKDSKEKFDLALLCISALVFTFFISLALKRYSLFGIDLALIFAAVITLFAAKRFGSVYALTLGFFASVGISAVHSVSFALLGLAAGALFPFGSLFALTAGIAALSAFSVYAGGLSGLLSLLPECMLGALLSYPLFRHLECERQEAASESALRTSQDMVGTMAMSYRLRRAPSAALIETALLEISALTERFIGARRYSVSEDMAMISRLIAEESEYSDNQREPDDKLTARAEEEFLGFGFTDGTVKVFGEREKYLILAAKDKDGSKISSPELRQRLEGALGVRLSPPHFFRRGDMALMECHATEKYRLTAGKATVTADGETVSGDTVSVFSAERGVFYALISDGMGSGECARATSKFLSDVLISLKELPSQGKSALYLLNSLIRRKGDECASTLDLMSFDKITGECRFFKAGAAPSFIKRGSSVFRIKSDTMPIGVLSSIDGESIRAEVKPGDLIVMMSDGVMGQDTDAPWLIEYLSRAEGSPSAIAERIVKLSLRQGERQDDTSVLVIKVAEI